jgi:glycosyltransferase involved in cell wall biosynthesis
LSLKARVRVLVIDLSNKFGGADARVTQLISRLSDDFEVKVAVLAGSETETRFIESGMPVVSIAAGRRSPRTVFALAKVIRQLNPSIIDAHNIQSQIWGLIAGAWLKVPVRIVTLHSVYENSERLGRRFGFYRRLLGLFRRLATAFVSVSGSIDAYLASNAIPGSIRTVIDNGIEVAVRPDGWQPPYSDTNSPLKIACIGRLVAVKGQEFLLNALASIEAKDARWECDLVGDGPDGPSLRRLVDELGIGDRVRFLGYRKDVSHILSHCDMVCMPSLSEGLPYTIFEAALLERPVVASAVGGIAEHFRHRETVYLVQPGEIDELRLAIEWAMNSRGEATELGRRARRFVETNFTAVRMAQQTSAFYMSAYTATKRPAVPA